MWPPTTGRAEPTSSRCGCRRRTSGWRSSASPSPCSGSSPTTVGHRPHRALRRSRPAALRALELQVVSRERSSPRGRWDLMNKWIDTLSTMKVAGLDVDGRHRPGRMGRPPARRRAAGVRHERHHRQELVPAADAVRRGPVAEDAGPSRLGASRSSPAGSGGRSSSSARSTATTGPRSTSARWSRRSGVPTPATSSPRSRCASRRSPGWAVSASASPTARRCRARSPRSSVRRPPSRRRTRSASTS